MLKLLKCCPCFYSSWEVWWLCFLTCKTNLSWRRLVLGSLDELVRLCSNRPLWSPGIWGGPWQTCETRQIWTRLSSRRNQHLGLKPWRSGRTREASFLTPPNPVTMPDANSKMRLSTVSGIWADFGKFGLPGSCKDTQEKWIEMDILAEYIKWISLSLYIYIYIIYDADTLIVYLRTISPKGVSILKNRSDAWI